MIGTLIPQFFSPTFSVMKNMGDLMPIAWATRLLSAIVQSIRKHQTRLNFAQPERWLDHNGCICPKMCVFTSANSRNSRLHWRKAPYYVIYGSIETDTHMSTVA